MATQITQLTLNEVSFVTDPANPEARILLLKRNADGQTEQRTKVGSPQGQASKATFIKDELMENVNNSDPGEALVRKCASAVAKGDVDSLTKTDFEKALDHMARSFDAEHHVGFYNAYTAAISTPLGRDLYQGYIGAPVGRIIRKAEVVPTPDSAAWTRIQELARQLRRPEESVASSIDRALIENGQLYDDLLLEEQQSQQPQ